MVTPGLTVVIPVFNLDSFRLRNLLFVISKLCNTTYKVLVIEQIQQESKLFLENISDNVAHLKFKASGNLIRKSWLINKSCNFVSTSHIWVIDCDFYMDFSTIDANTAILHDYYQPYHYSRDLTEKETLEFYINPDIRQIKYYNGLEDSHRHVNIYGALSFIFNITRYIDIGGMDERYIGWGHEDIDLFLKLHTPDNGKKIEINRECTGVHLWHPAPPKKIGTNNSNLAIFGEKGYSIDLATELTLKYYYPAWGKR